MSYTDHAYLNRMVSLAIEYGAVTSEEAYILVGKYGSDHEHVMVDILWIVYRRCKDKKKLEEMQSVYREYRSSLHSS
jgi:uncharacterized protein (UPF0264 family)